MKLLTGPTDLLVLAVLLQCHHVATAWIQSPSSTRKCSWSAGLQAISQPSSASSSSSSSPPQKNPPATAAASQQLPQQMAAIPRMSSPTMASSSVGRILEGGKVIDFGAVKASSKAERALLEARQIVLQRPAQAMFGDMILGINQDVIDEVGHDLGRFASADEVQACSAYLRVKAPANMFEERVNGDAKQSNNNSMELSSLDVAKYKSTMTRAYDEAGEVTAAFAKTFYMGTMLLGDDARRAIWAIYVWCRRTDEIVDAPRDDDQDMLLDLSSWELRLENLFRYGEVVDVYDLCLLDVRIQYPTLDIQPFLDMIRGMLMDVPGLGQDRYETFDELHLYCYRVAGTVGVMSLPIFGCAPGFDDEVAR